jgi:acyl carrier protein
MELEKQIRDFVIGNFYVADPSSLGDGDSLLEQGVMDSTGVMELIEFLQRTFDFQVADAEMVPENLESIARISAYVTRKVGEPNRG